eukprot:8379056-Pyramimonas_sp.AAC.1
MMKEAARETRDRLFYTAPDLPGTLHAGSPEQSGGVKTPPWPRSSWSPPSAPSTRWRSRAR